jgi:hypothetical protein
MRKHHKEDSSCWEISFKKSSVRGSIHKDSSVRGSVGMFYRQRMLVIDGKYNNDDQQRSDNRGGAATVIVGSTIQNSRWLSDLNVDKKSTDMEDRSRALDPSTRTDHRRIQENLHDL